MGSQRCACAAGVVERAGGSEAVCAAIDVAEPGGGVQGQCWGSTKSEGCDHGWRAVADQCRDSELLQTSGRLSAAQPLWADGDPCGYCIDLVGWSRGMAYAADDRSAYREHADLHLG